jgi:hypothetical protein
MKGSPGSLSIAAGESEQSSTVVWQKSGHQGDGWLTVSVDLPAYSTKVKSKVAHKIGYVKLESAEI